MNFRVSGFLVVGLFLGFPLAADVYFLKNGDRVTGRSLLEGNRSFRIQTRYGRLTVPRAAIRRVLRDNGKEEVLNSEKSAETSIAAESKVSLAHLGLVITGKTFWYAWDPPKGGTVDPTLRLQVHLDQELIASYVDPRLDPKEMPGVMVNAFVFEDVIATPGGITQVLAPLETQPGRIVLKIEFPLEKQQSIKRDLRVAYQINEGTETATSWRDVTSAVVGINLQPGANTWVHFFQDRGQMTFSGWRRRRMKGVETFHIEARLE